MALSSGEADYQSLAKAGRVSLGINAPTSKLGIVFDNPIEIDSDASAAIGVSNRVGSGKITHIEATQLVLQEKLRTNIITVNEVNTDTT